MNRLTSQHLVNRVKQSCIFVIIALLTSITGQTKPIQIPLSESFGVEPNVMIHLDTSGSMAAGVEGTDNGNGELQTRIEVAKEATRNVVNKVNNVRFCLSAFQPEANPSNSPDGQANREGAKIYAQCNSSSSNIDEIDTHLSPTSILTAISGTGATPLAESLYDITRYFRGKPAKFGDPTNIHDDNPIEYRCQANTVIMVTDGDPTADWDLPLDSTYYDDIVDAEDGKTMGPDGDWDGDANDPVIESGFNRPSRELLDDLALFGQDIDFVPATGDDTTADVIPTDEAAGSFDSADFPKQTLTTHTIGFFIDSSSLQLAASKGGGSYTAIDPSDPNSQATLEQAIIDSISTATLNPNATGAGGAQTSIALDENLETNIFITTYDTSDWSGDLIKVIAKEKQGVGSNNPTLEVKDNWSAATKLEQRTSNRKIFTNDSSNNAYEFLYDNLNNTQKNLLSGENEGENKRLIEYIRGDSLQGASVDPNDNFRTRSQLLGDLVHSRPIYVKDFDHGYLDLDYIQFLTSGAAHARNEMVYVGGNDGMLHAFNASDDIEGGGEELFAYLPNSAFQDISDLSLPQYNENHAYFVDGEMSIVDAKLKKPSTPEWSTVLASPFGAGLKGLFMLDVTNPQASYDNLFGWEITEASSGFSEMGYVLNSPKIVRLKVPDATNNDKTGEKWVLIIGNGVHSEDANDDDTMGKAVVYVIDLDTGAQIIEFVIDDGKNENNTAAYNHFDEANGATSVAAVDLNADTYVDLIYAADLKGKISRINYANAIGSSTEDPIAYIQNNLVLDSTPVFQATGPKRPTITSPISAATGTDTQPITAELTVTGPPASSDSKTGVMIFFGTGQYFDINHKLRDENLAVQSMYAVWDNNGGNLTRSNLVEQEIALNANGDRTFNNTAIDYKNGGQGWYIDLPNYGERITRKSIALFEHMAFFSSLPASLLNDPCIPGEVSWGMIAKKDQATEIFKGGVEQIGGILRSSSAIQDPIFVELSNGEFVAPVIDPTMTNDDTVNYAFESILKDYARASWKRIRQ